MVNNVAVNFSLSLTPLHNDSAGSVGMALANILLLLLEFKAHRHQVSWQIMQQLVSNKYSIYSKRGWI